MVKEAELKLAIHQYLQIEQNLGHLVYNRQNSGEVLVARGDKRYKVNLCQTGTPDFIVHKGGGTFYLEAKGDKGKVSPQQEQFSLLLCEQRVFAYVVRSMDEVMELINDNY